VTDLTSNELKVIYQALTLRLVCIQQNINVDDGPKDKDLMFRIKQTSDLKYKIASEINAMDILGEI
jgi:hypothetical protein